MNNKTYAIVTGASSGIGYAYARILAEKGFNLLIVSNEADAIREKAEILRKEFPVDVIPLERDLGRQEAALELYEYCKEQGIETEMLINNAGVYHDRDFLDDSAAFNSLILNLHVYTPAMMMYYFGQDMVKRGRGYILNMSSVTSKFAAQRLGSYSSTKGFIQSLSRSMHIELREKGVNVTCVRPGAVATSLYNLKPAALKAGLAIGYITTPEKLARKGIDALLKGKAQITPGLYTKILDGAVALLPTCALRLIRRLKIF